MLKTNLLFALVLALPVTLSAQTRKPMDHDVHDIWNTISQRAISNDGAWVFLSVGPEEKDRELRIRRLDGDRSYVVDRGEAAAFSADARYVVTRIKAFRDSVKQGKRDKLKPDKMPKDSLGVVSLETGKVDRIARVKSYKMPRVRGDWLAYLHEKSIEQPDSMKADEKSASEKGSEEESEEPEKKEEKAAKETPDKKPNEKKDRKKTEGTELVLRRLSTGEETAYEHVVAYDFAEVGNWIVFTTASKDSSADGISAVHTATGERVVLLEGPGDYKGAVIDSAGTQVAFLSNRDSFAADQPAFTLYHWEAKSRKVRSLARAGTPGVPEGWWVSEHGKLSFSQDGKRLFFGTSPRPEADPEEEVAEDEKVVLDVWHWKDPLLQPNQLKRLKDEKNRSYQAVVHLKSGKVVQLATRDIPDIRLGSQGNADVCLGLSALPYRQLVSWDTRYYDAYLIDVTSGGSRRILTRTRHRPSLSPESTYAFWWDHEDARWMAMDVRKRRAFEISSGIPYPLFREDHDTPSDPGAYGSAGWTADDASFLIYDRHDIWETDPKGKRQPRNLTAGAGRADSLRFRYVRLDRDERSRDPKQPFLLATHSYRTKAGGFHRASFSGDAPPRQLILEDRLFSNPTKARDADRFLLTRSRFDEFPDLYVSDPDFSRLEKVSDVNPQQDDYLWGTAELTAWTSLDGDRLQGMLFKPEGFDPGRTYPMIVYFYERMSHILHRYAFPRPNRSSIVPSFYTSRGYVVFMPDIRFKTGFPGESAVNAVIPGVTHLIDQGFVDPDRIGVQGHSWGGYQIAYLVTRSDIFAAAEAGAPVSNMVSAYGGIRWGSGLSRMMQYEKSQSRIGGSLWEAPTRYLENSPIFWADKVKTPLLMMHNDQDGAVPWYQGIEMFVALRRLGKPVWMLNYNGEEHVLKKMQNKKDFTIRLQQFFDHYLKGAPAPVWLAEGIPAVQKGKTLGLEVVPEMVPE